MAGFFKEDSNGKVTYTGTGEVIYYIPENYFDTKKAIVVGEIIETIGIFTYELRDNNGKKVKQELFSCPTMISCKPSSITKEAELLLPGSKEAKAFRLLHFKNGDELICNTNVPKSVDNVEKFVDLLIRAKLPDTIPYDMIHEYIIENANLNGFNYKVSGQLFGILISELYRDPKDLSKPFRLSDMTDMTGYQAISILKIPKYTSPYTAITSENADEAIAAAITTKGKTDSPLEKVMMN